jgi:transcriptional regulator with XRE-family HTH domain
MEREGLSFRDLEAATGFSASYLCRVANGQRKPSPLAVRKLARALRMRPEELGANATTGSVLRPRAGSAVMVTVCCALLLADMVRDLVPLTKVPNHRPWVTVRWLRRATYERRLPFHRVGGKVLVDLTDLDRMAEAGRVEAEQ